MKGIRITELWANIKANAVAFLSIAMFVSLGIGLFLGIQWGAVGLRNAALETINEGNMHDISVQFPYGITQNDLNKLKAVEGVSEIETGYSSFAIMKDGSNAYTVKMQSLPKSINKPTNILGNLPMEKDEVAILRFWAEKVGISIGDTITLKHDAKATFNSDGTTSEDKDGMEYLNADKYKVTALVDTPEYLYKNSTSIGVSNLGSGDVDFVGFVMEDAFDKSKFEDGYPNVYVRCDELDGISVFTSEYKDRVAPVVDRITELGGTLGTARYNELHKKAQDKLDEAQDKIDDGERQLSEGKDKIDDGERQLSEGKEKLDDGQKDLVDGATTGAVKQQVAQSQLNEAYRQLADGQAKYDAGVQTYMDTMDLITQIVSLLGSIDTTSSDLNNIEEALDSLGNKLDDLSSSLDSGRTYDLSASSNSDAMMPEDDLSESDTTEDGSTSGTNALDNATINYKGTEISLSDLPVALDELTTKLIDAKAELDEGKAVLDAGWEEYYRNKALYDQSVAEGTAQLVVGQQEVNNGRETLKDKEQELEDGKKTLEEKTKKLEDGKQKLEDAKEQFNLMEEYEWVVMPRQASGALMGLVTASNMMDNVKWAMALLFILVGLFVCYSAISRLVHEQIIQIGTKKALGFRTGEVTSHYLWFSGLAVLIGILVCILIAIFLVQGIMNPVAARQYTITEYGAHFDIVDVLIMGGIELLLILASTWLATHGLLKRNAIDLLRGESTANVKERFYERWGIWQRMSLFSQTVVNNCINDTRRVIGTLVGVIGCTALIVVAITLWGNIADSLTRHYQTVYHFDAMTYLNSSSEEEADKVALALYNRGITSAPAYTRKLQARKADGTRNLVSLMVPTNDDSFNKIYTVTSTDGKQAEIGNGGIWISEAYSVHQGTKVGDDVTLTEFNGKTHTFKVAGIFKYYLIRYEFVLSQNEYRQAFGDKPAPNVLLTNMDGADVGRTRDALADVDGYNSLVEDKVNASYAYDELNSIMTTVVLIYLALSALMALMVLLNLDIMFVDEKKRELIVLMICGFSTKDAKAYIYRDSIVLTIIGIILGILLGAIMGGITVAALEPELVYWLKGMNLLAVVVGALGAGVFAAAVLLWALRRIPRFDLTDINRF